MSGESRSFFLLRQFPINLFQFDPIAFIQLGQPEGKLLSELVGRSDGLGSGPKNLFFPGFFLEGFALTSAKPDLIDAKLPADIQNNGIRWNSVCAFICSNS